MSTTPDFWQPRLSASGGILSGSASIWFTLNGVSTRLAERGAAHCWAGFAPVWNDTATHSTRFNSYGDHQAFHEYSGSEDFRWAGFDASGNGRTDIFHNGNKAGSLTGACKYRFGGERTAYLTPFQSEQRQLIVNGAPIASGRLIDVALSREGAVLVYSAAVDNAIRILSEDGKNLSVRHDEILLLCFLGPGGQPWIMTNTPNSGVLIYPAFSSVGYRIDGELFDPDARMTDGRLRVVGSLNNGALREVWIDFAAPRVDLRLV